MIYNSKITAWNIPTKRGAYIATILLEHCDYQGMWLKHQIAIGFCAFM